MKSFYIILCVCFAVFITIESKGTVKKYTEELSSGHSSVDMCRNASGITLEYMEQLNKTDEELETPEMEGIRMKIGCFMSCLLQQKEIMNGSEVHTQKIIDMLKLYTDSSEESTVSKIDQIVGVVQNCGKKVENMTNACEVAWTFGKCISPIAGI